MSKNSLKTYFFCTNNELTNNKRLTLTLTLSLGHFFVSGPLGVPKCVPEEVFGHIDSFGSLTMNISQGAKNRFFFNGGVLAIWPKMTKF